MGNVHASLYRARVNVLIAQRRVRAGKAANSYEALCPTIRFPVVTDVTVDQEVPGGWVEASFTIPMAYRRHGLETLPHSALDLPVWIMDGLATVFHGVVAKVIPNDQGDLEVTCDGDYRLLGATRMRAVWADTDLTELVQAPGSAGGASMAVDASGRLVFSFPKDHSFPAGAYIAADYFLFDEAVGVRDSKKIDSFKVAVGTASTFDGAANLEMRVYGMASPSDTTPNLLQTIQNSGVSVMHVSDATHGAGNVNPWPITAGFRCIRVGLYAAGAVSAAANDHSAVVTSFQVSTRGRVGVGLRTPYPSTSDIAKDVWTDGQTYDLHAFLTEEYAGSTGAMVTGNIPDSGQKAFGISLKEWSEPREAVEAMAELDGNIVGMWGPTKAPPSTAHVVSAGNTSANYWYRQPPELTYKAWNDLGDPDYHVRLGKGAEWTPDGQPDDLVSAAYVGYSSLRGASLSVFTEDASTENLTYEQGLHTAEDSTIDPSVDTQTATTLGSTYVRLRRQPTLSGELKLYGDRLGSWELPGGGRGMRLYSIRPGVVRIVDAKGPKAGRITRLHYEARTADHPETLTLSVNSPADSILALQTARLARRAARNRHR
jgi:hypothetical protein